MIIMLNIMIDLFFIAELPMSECFSFCLTTLLTDVAYKSTELQEQVSRAYIKNTKRLLIFEIRIFCMENVY